MTTDPKRTPDEENPGHETNPPAGQETTPAQEWGERVDTGKTIARGGKDAGRVPGADEKQSG